MKVVSMNELVKIVSEKVGVDVNFNNFKDFSEFIEDIYPEFNIGYKDLAHAVYYRNNITIPERIFKIETKVFKDIYEDLKSEIGFIDEEDVFEDEAYDPIESIDQIKTDIVEINYVDRLGNSIFKDLKLLQKISKENNINITFSTGGIDDQVYCNHHFQWNIIDGNIVNDNSYVEIEDDNHESLLYSLYWLYQVFYNDSFEEFESLGVEVRYNNTDPNLEIEEDGQLLLVQYKYGNKNNILSSYEESLKLIKKYPILFKVLPEKYKDKNMILTFIETNGKYVKEYNEREKHIQEKIQEELDNNCSCAHHEGDLDLRNNAVIDGSVDFGKFTKDVDVLVASVEAYKDYIVYSGCLFGFELKSNNYDEKAFIEAIRKEPLLVTKLYMYWDEVMGEDLKEQEKLKNKFELYNNPSPTELAMFKCVSMVDKDNDIALAQLFALYCMALDFSINEDHIEINKKLFSLMSKRIQNIVVNAFYYYAKYLKDGVLEKDKEEHIAKNCPIAGDILSDKAIIKYNLKQHNSEEETIETCFGCYKCQLVRCIFS